MFKTLIQKKIDYQLKLKAAEMRINGDSYRTIAKALKVSRNKAKDLCIEAKLDYLFSQEIEELNNLRLLKYAQFNLIRKNLHMLMEEHQDNPNLHFKCLNQLFELIKREADLFGINLVDPTPIYHPNPSISMRYVADHLKPDVEVKLNIPLVIGKKEAEMVPIGGQNEQVTAPQAGKINVIRG